MINDKKIVVILPAYNAEKTLRQTYDRIPHDIVDSIILTDDASQDGTAGLSRTLGIETIVHDDNRGYGANQKTCYAAALDAGADIIVMLHPDYQYDPRLLRAMSSLIAEGVYDAVIGSRILGGGALKGGMPFYKYVANRLLTLAENIATGAKLSEYHTGYRAFSREVLTTVPFEGNSDDFLFDNQMLIQVIHHGFSMGEISCPTSYHSEASSINLRRSVVYGLGCIQMALLFLLSRWGIYTSPVLGVAVDRPGTGARSGRSGK